MERQGASPQPWKILSKGRVDIGPKGRLRGQSGVGPYPPNGTSLPKGCGNPELSPRSS